MPINKANATKINNKMLTDFQKTNALIFTDKKILRDLYEHLTDEIFYEATGINEYLYDHKKFTFQDFLQDILHIESDIVRTDLEEIYYDRQQGYSNYVSLEEADEFGFTNTIKFYKWLDLQVRKEEALENLIENLQTIIKKDAVRKISNFFLECKYSPNTRYGKKYIESLYEENF